MFLLYVKHLALLEVVCYYHDYYLHVRQRILKVKCVESTEPTAKSVEPAGGML